MGALYAGRTCAILVLLLAVGAPAFAQYQAELTFDDGDDGSTAPELNNMETSSGVTARFEGAARRSSLSEGRYGRAADFPGGQGAVVLEGWVPGDAFVAHLWLAVRDSQSGSIVQHDGSWDVHLSDGQVVVRAFRSPGEPVILPGGIPWPEDRDFHHLTVRIIDLTAAPRFELALDFAAPVTVAAGFDPATSAAPLRLADGLDGMLDEPVVANRIAATRSAEQDEFNRNPGLCPDGTSCVEEMFNLVPRTFTHEVPVRFKSVWNPAACTAEAPCPLLVAINGGEACANDYTPPVDLVAMVELGFVVVTVDPYCEGNGRTLVPETEVSQFTAVKDYVFESGAVRDLVTGPQYAATGCSHGAEAVLVWALFEPDHPARTFARSAGGAGLCARVAGKICGVPGGTENLPVSIESDRARELHLRGDFVAQVSTDIATTREIARSWGTNLQGPVCVGDNPACTEEGKWGMTYASRRFRDVWEATQAEETPTGYFVEDLGADCRHCAPVDSEAFRCGMCLLLWGRAGMSSECPGCLTYTDETIAHGGESELCPLEASWYVDPIADLNEEPGPDGGVVTDTVPGPDAGQATDETASGGGCATSSGERRPAGWLFAFLALGWLLQPRGRSLISHFIPLEKVD